MLNLLYIAVFGALGAVSRYSIGIWLQHRGSGEMFPFGTLLVNVVGCFLLGFLAGLSTQAVSKQTNTALSAGFLGAFTTFSTFGFETVTLLEKGRGGLALGNVGANLVLGLLAAWLGILAAKAIGK